MTSDPHLRRDNFVPPPDDGEDDDPTSEGMNLPTIILLILVILPVWIAIAFAARWAIFGDFP